MGGNQKSLHDIAALLASTRESPDTRLVGYMERLNMAGLGGAGDMSLASSRIGFGIGLSIAVDFGVLIAPFVHLKTGLSASAAAPARTILLLERGTTEAWGHSVPRATENQLGDPVWTTTRPIQLSVLDGRQWELDASLTGEAWAGLNAPFGNDETGFGAGLQLKAGATARRTTLVDLCPRHYALSDLNGLSADVDDLLVKDLQRLTQAWLFVASGQANRLAQLASTPPALLVDRGQPRMATPDRQHGPSRHAAVERGRARRLLTRFRSHAKSTGPTVDIATTAWGAAALPNWALTGDGAAALAQNTGLRYLNKLRDRIDDRPWDLQQLANTAEHLRVAYREIEKSLAELTSQVASAGRQIDPSTRNALRKDLTFAEFEQLVADKTVREDLSFAEFEQALAEKTLREDLTFAKFQQLVAEDILRLLCKRGAKRPTPPDPGELGGEDVDDDDDEPLPIPPLPEEIEDPDRPPDPPGTNHSIFVPTDEPPRWRSFVDLSAANQDGGLVAPRTTLNITTVSGQVSGEAAGAVSAVLPLLQHKNARASLQAKATVDAKRISYRIERATPGASGEAGRRLVTTQDTVLGYNAHLDVKVSGNIGKPDPDKKPKQWSFGSMNYRSVRAIWIEDDGAIPRALPNGSGVSFGTTVAVPRLAEYAKLCKKEATDHGAKRFHEALKVPGLRIFSDDAAKVERHLLENLGVDPRSLRAMFAVTDVALDTPTGALIVEAGFAFDSHVEIQSADGFGADVLNPRRDLFELPPVQQRVKDRDTTPGDRSAANNLKTSLVVLRVRTRVQDELSRSGAFTLGLNPRPWRTEENQRKADEEDAADAPISKYRWIFTRDGWSPKKPNLSETAVQGGLTFQRIRDVEAAACINLATVWFPPPLKMHRSRDNSEKLVEHLADENRRSEVFLPPVALFFQ